MNKEINQAENDLLRISLLRTLPERVKKMAPSTGLEPVTYGLTVRRSTD